MLETHHEISQSLSPHAESDEEPVAPSSGRKGVVGRPRRRKQTPISYNDSSDASDASDLSDSSRESHPSRQRRAFGTKEGSSSMLTKVQRTVDSFLKRPSRSPDVVISSNTTSKSESDNETDGDVVEVPDSSPLKILQKGTSMELDSSPVQTSKTKLPSFRSFAYQEPVGGSQPASGISSNSKIMENYHIFRKEFPHLTQRVILNAIRQHPLPEDTRKYLEALPKTVSKKPQSEGFRLSSLSRDVTVLSSSPLKGSSSSDLRLAKLQREKQKERERARRQAERESVKSSKVVLNSKKSISNNFLNQRRRLYREDDKNDRISLDNSSEESSAEDSAESSDSSVQEVLSVSRERKRRKTPRYEDDDDFDPIKKPVKKVRIKSKGVKSNREDRVKRRHEMEDSLLPEFEQDEDAGLGITEKFLKLVNNADIRDIIDLSNIKPAEAEIIVQKRPYGSIAEFMKLKLKDAKNKDRATAYTERVVETCKQKLMAYGAIDSLVKQCFAYSKDLTKEIVKWGVTIEGQTTGEVSITEVKKDIHQDEPDESPLTYNEVSAHNSDSDSDVRIVENPKRHRWRAENDSDGEEDADFGAIAKTIQKSRLNLNGVKDKIGYFHKSPKLFAEGIQLKDYQQVGLNWLNLLYQKQLSCILADEMGLGKTIQVIALIAHLKEVGYPGPHLVVVPSSTLENWLREFEKFAPEIDVVPYYGSLSEREELRSVLLDGNFDVMVTTYNLATVGKLDQPFLRSFDFNAIVYDEGHMLKNAASDRYKKLTKLRAHFRVLLTGTPLQNNLKELVSLLDFILPEVFDTKMDQLQFLFDQKATTKDDDKIEGESYNPLLSQQAIAKAKVMMTPFILRRTKAQVMKELPAKHSNIEYTEMTPHQREIYDEQLRMLDEQRLERNRRQTLTKEEQKGLPPLKSTSILMALRKACMHPLLFRSHYTDKLLKVMARDIMKNPQYAKADQDYIYEDMEVMSDFELTNLCIQFPNELGKFVLKQSTYMDSGKVEKLLALLEGIIERGEKVLVFSLFTQMLDILEKVVSIKGWKFLRLDGSTAVDTRQDMIDKFYADKNIPIFLLSTKAGGFGINLVCATNVIIFDQSFNPHDDKQAEDRAHRVGQTKEVNVTRLIMRNTVEENILQMAFNKLQLDQSMMKQPTEDMLLKTVEDMLASKEDDDKERTSESTTKAESTPAQDAFETKVDLEEAANSEDEDDVKIVEKEQENGRSRRRRKQITYVDDVDLNGLVETDSDSEFEYKEENHDAETKKNNTTVRRSTRARGLDKEATNQPSDVSVTDSAIGRPDRALQSESVVMTEQTRSDGHNSPVVRTPGAQSQHAIYAENSQQGAYGPCGPMPPEQMAAMWTSGQAPYNPGTMGSMGHTAQHIPVFAQPHIQAPFMFTENTYQHMPMMPGPPVQSHQPIMDTIQTIPARNGGGTAPTSVMVETDNKTIQTGQEPQKPPQ